MKTVSLLGILVVIGGVGGAGYAEFDRVTTIERSAKEHVFQLTRVYIQDQEKAKTAAATAVKKCVNELYFVEFPPVLTSFLAENATVEYEIVRKYGSKARQQKDEVEDMRNALSAEYYDHIDEELEALPRQQLKRTLQVMRDYNGNRKKISRCIHQNAYQVLKAEGLIES
jgi:hypothetical protein